MFLCSQISTRESRMSNTQEGLFRQRKECITCYLPIRLEVVDMVNRLVTKDHTGPSPDPYCKFFFQSILEPTFMEGVTYTIQRISM